HVLPERLPLSFETRIDDVEALLEPMVKRGDVPRVVLKVIIHDHDHFAAGDIQPGHDRVVLPNILAQIDPGDEVVLPSELDNDFPAFVQATVVDEDQLVAVKMRAHLVLNSARELRQASSALVYRDDNG